MFTQALWDEWSAIESKNYQVIAGKKKYLKRGYAHFDHRFWFPDKHPELLLLLQNGLKAPNPKTGFIQWHPFTPFIKQLLKTPRYRYQEETDHYELECKIRPISYASHFDSLIFAFYSYGLNKKYQDYIINNGFGECVLAYRSDTGNCNIQYSKEVFDHVKAFNRAQGGCTVISLDIKGYFDNIDHAILKDKWAKIWGGKLPDDQFKLFQALTEYSYVSRDSLLKKYGVDERKLKKKGTFPQTLFELVPGSSIQGKYDRLKQDRIIARNWDTKRQLLSRGIPQGSSISALLSNIYLIDYDQTMATVAAEKGVIYRRYCDDIVLICPAALAHEFKDFAITEIKEKYCLTIQQSKAEIIDFMPNVKGIVRSFRRRKGAQNTPIQPTQANERKLYKNLQYLGFEFNGVDTFIRASSVSRYFRKMKARLDKTVKMAYSPGGEGDKIYRFQIYERYSHLGTQNFITYAQKAAKARYKNRDNEWRVGHDSPAIRMQLARHVKVLNEALEKKNRRRFGLKRHKGKKVRRKEL